MVPDYLALGHITRDLLPDGSHAPGGTAFYAAAAAARLGLRAAVLAAGDAQSLPLPPAGVSLAASFSANITTFENQYGPDGRRQRLHAVGQSLSLAALPEPWRAAPIVHLAPVVHEVELELAASFPGALVGATPQGWMRVWQESLPALVRYQAWRPAPALLARLGLLVLSIEDVRGDEALAASYAASCPLVAVTRGAAGATLYIDGASHTIAPCAAIERDPTGAGDVFAAALLAHLRETGEPLAAAAFASAAAACSIEGSGVVALPDRALVLARLAESA